MDETTAKHIMGQNFIGSVELRQIQSQSGLPDPLSFGPAPSIPFDQSLLEQVRGEYLLILGMPQNEKGEPLTIVTMRSMFGWDPEKAEPCFYNQDWYLQERFARETTLEFRWYLLRKSIDESSKGKNPETIEQSLEQRQRFPLAVLTAFAFFAASFVTERKEILWKNEFVWCADKDAAGDRIYAGRYEDPHHINKNGFNVHRHLSIKPWYGTALQIV